MNTVYKEYDFNCDVWSVGVIAYEMLTGEKPYEAKDDNALKAFLKAEDFRINWKNKKLDKEDVAFLKLCLEIRTKKKTNFCEPVREGSWKGLVPENRTGRIQRRRCRRICKEEEQETFQNALRR